MVKSKKMKIITDSVTLEELKQMAFIEQMANIGSEVERALELTDLTLESVSGFPRLKELARMREALVDSFCGSNQFKSSDELWRKYFLNFTYAARRGR